MTSNENKQLRTCTKKGLIELINDPKYTQNKANQFAAIVGYLARHGMSASRKDEFLDMVYTARNELLAQEAKRHAEANQPLPYDDFGGLKGAAKARVKAFIADPVGAIASEMKNLYERKEDYSQIEDPDEIQYYQDLKVSANIIGIELGIAGEQDKTKYADKPDMVDITTRLSKKMPEKDANLSASLKRINSGFFGTLFRRRSKEYAAFEESFNTFRNPKMALSGNVEDLEKNTTAYLKHLIPDFQYGENMPKEQWLAALPKGQRKRAGFALDVLDSIHENKKMKPFMDNVEKAAKGLPVDKKVDQPAVMENAKEQKQFQKELQNDIEPKVEEKKEPVAEEKKEPVVEEKKEPVEPDGLNVA